jgi:hypothetical protein
VNLCRTCGEDFGSVTAFDAHHVGKHAYLFSPDRLNGRRCLTPAEMRARGFTKNGRGRWSLSTYIEVPQEEVDLAGAGTYAGKDNS